MSTTQNKENFRNFLIYNFPVWIQVAINFLLLPVYTAYLAPEDFGVRAIVLLSILVLNIFTNFGINWVIRSKYYSFNSDQERNSFLSTIFIITLLPRIILFVIFYFVSIKVFPLLFNSWDGFYNDLFKIQLAIFLINFPQEIFFAIYIMERLSKKYSFVVLCKYFSSVFVSLFSLLILKKGIYSLFYGELVGSFIYQSISFYIFRKNIVFNFRKNAVLDVIKIGLPAIPKSLFQQIQINIDKYILQIFLPVGELGIFSKSQFLYTGVSGFNKAFSNAFSPSYLKNMTESGKDNTTNKVMLYWLFIISSLLMLSVLFMVDIFKIIRVNPAFWICAKYAPFYAINILITSYALMYGNNILISKKTYLFTICSVVCGVINIGANLLLIPRLGINGAIIATLISGFTFFIIELYFSERLLKFKTDINLWIYFLIIGILLTTYLFINYDLLVSLYMKTIIMIIYIGFLFMIDYFFVGGYLFKNFSNKINYIFNKKIY